MEDAITLHRITSRALLSSLPRVRTVRENFLLLLLSRKGSFVRYGEIIETLWSPKWEPENPKHILRVHVHHLRRSGWNIKGWYSQGYCVS